MHNRFGEEESVDRTEKKDPERMTPVSVFVNTFWVFVVLFVSFLIGEAVGTVFGWIVPPDSIDSTKDLTRNFYLVYPLYGLIAGGVTFVCRYFFARLLGARQGFRTKEHTQPSHHFVHFVLAYVVYEFLSIYFFWNVLPSWFLGGSLAAVMRIFNASNLYDTVFEGRVEILYLTAYFWWIMAILEAGFLILSHVVVKKGRYKGEEDAIRHREERLKELEEEHEKLMKS